jgi:hypothetical protein
LSRRISVTWLKFPSASKMGSVHPEIAYPAAFVDAAVHGLGPLAEAGSWTAGSSASGVRQRFSPRRAPPRPKADEILLVLAAPLVDVCVHVH